MWGGSLSPHSRSGAPSRLPTKPKPPLLVPAMRIEPGKAPAYAAYGRASSSTYYHPDAEAINSEDELDPSDLGGASMSAAVTEQDFVQQLHQRGLELRQMKQDGNCLFRAVADRVYGDAEMHDVVRRLCLDHMERERDHFSPYITQDFDDYILRKRRPMTFGNHVEIQAISEIYNRPVEVFDARGDARTPMNIFQAPTEDESSAPAAVARSQPLRLSYHGRSHYNALVDPARPDVGEGLGLPGYEPGLADRMQVARAVGESEVAALDAQLLCEAQGASEMEATQEAILQAALKASLKEAQQPHATDEAASSSTATTGTGASSAAAAAPPVVAPPASTVAPQPGALGGLDVDPAVLGETVRTLLAMGFSLERAVQAHALFGDDLDSSIEYLTGDQ